MVWRGGSHPSPSQADRGGLLAASASKGRSSSRARWVGFVLAALSGNSLPDASAAVFGDDERVRLTRGHRLDALGAEVARLTCRDPATGRRLVATATRVAVPHPPPGESLLLTAAHAVINERNGVPWPGCRVRFHGQWRSRPVRLLEHGHFDGSVERNPQDWALIAVPARPDDPPGLSIWNGPLPDPVTVALLANRADRRGLWVSAGCTVLPAALTGIVAGDRLLFSDCDASPGSSGAPLLIQSEQGWQWLGLYRGHWYRPADHSEPPDFQPRFHPPEATNIMVRPPELLVRPR